MSYAISGKKSLKYIQNTFNRLCEDIRTGKYTNPITDKDGNILEGEITPERFKPCYAELDDSNIFKKCRMQMPKQWFISQDGIIISLEKKTPIWYNKGNKNGRTDREIQCKIGATKDRQFVGDGNECVTPYNYTLVAIVYESLYALGEEHKENIRKYGLEAFGVGNSGRQKNKTVKDENGPKGLVINGVEIIKPEDMIDVHHIEGAEIIDPDLLEIMPHWLHEKCKYFTASVETTEELQKLLKKEKKIFTIAPHGFYVIDYSKELRDGKWNRYIHYNGINKEKYGQADAKKYKFFAIKILDSESEAILNAEINSKILNQGNLIITPTKEFYKWIAEKKKREKIEFIRNQGMCIFEFYDNDKRKRLFGIQYVDGDIDNYIDLINKIANNKKYRREEGNKTLKLFKKHPEQYLRYIKNEDRKCNFVVYSEEYIKDYLNEKRRI